MRLSLLISIALLFGSVLAMPMDPNEPPSPPQGGGGKGKERAKSGTPPSEGGSHHSSEGSHPSQSSDSTDAGLGFVGGPNKGFGALKTQHFVSVFFFGHYSCSERNADSTPTS